MSDLPAFDATDPQAQVLEVLRQSALFAELDLAFVQAAGWQLERLGDGQLLFAEGEQADAVFIVISGVLGLFTGPRCPDHPLFRKVFRGDLVGEYALLCGEPRSASAVALTTVEFVRLPAAGFESLLAACPGLQRAMLRRLALQASRGRQFNRPAPTTIGVALAEGAGADARAVLAALLKAVRCQWRCEGGLVIEGMVAGAGLEEALVEGLEAQASHAVRSGQCQGAVASSSPADRPFGGDWRWSGRRSLAGW